MYKCVGSKSHYLRHLIFSWRKKNDPGNNKISYLKRLSFLWCSAVQLVCVDRNNFLSKLQSRESILSCHSKLQFKLRDFNFMDSLMVISAITAKWALYYRGPTRDLTRNIPTVTFSPAIPIMSAWLYCTSLRLWPSCYSTLLACV